ncbi:MAG: hypothetical protein LBR22_01945 [Desulfovibrio sp.]|jgi:hypothetical protein|nr:hypothetical protein [Desulfovibrio sp.]
MDLGKKPNLEQEGNPLVMPERSARSFPVLVVVVLAVVLVAGVAGYFFLTGQSNPILGTWKVDIVEKLPDGQYRPTIDLGTMTFTEEEIIVSNASGEKKFKAFYRVAENGKVWYLSPDEGKTFNAAEFSGSDEMFCIYNNQLVRFVRQW